MRACVFVWVHISKQWLCSTHWGRVTHIYVSTLIIIGSDSGLSPGRRQAIIWTNGGILLIGPWRINFSSYIFIQEHALESVVSGMSAILHQCVKIMIFASLDIWWRCQCLSSLHVRVLDFFYEICYGPTESNRNACIETHDLIWCFHVDCFTETQIFMVAS